VYRHLPRGSEREEGTKPWDGLLVEIQYRTRAQHAYTSACVEPAARHHAPMSTAHHYDHPPRPCWYCVHWAGPAWGDPYLAACRQGGVASCQANAANGCVHWMRETGVDDDGWRPAPLVRPKSPADKPFEMTPELYAVIRQIQADLDRRG